MRCWRARPMASRPLHPWRRPEQSTSYGLPRGQHLPQRALGGRAQAKLRGQLPEAASDTREMVGSRARPAQVVDWRSPDAVQVHKPHEEGAVCLQKRRERRPVEPGCMVPDLPQDTAHALVALPDGLRWAPRCSWGQFGRSRVAHDFTGPACCAPFCCRRASRFARLASAFSLRRTSFCLCSRFTLQY